MVELGRASRAMKKKAAGGRGVRFFTSQPPLQANYRESEILNVFGTLGARGIWRYERACAPPPLDIRGLFQYGKTYILLPACIASAASSSSACIVELGSLIYDRLCGYYGI